MAVSSKLLALAGIRARRSSWRRRPTSRTSPTRGWREVRVSPNDLVVAVSGDDEAACAEALAKGRRAARRAPARDDGAAAAEQPLTSIQMAVAARSRRYNFALISVPGDYAAAEAMKALRLGMDVMMFSDNVPVEAELALKQLRATSTT